jgi:hypothetical protein
MRLKTAPGLRLKHVSHAPAVDAFVIVRRVEVDVERTLKEYYT